MFLESIYRVDANTNWNPIIDEVPMTNLHSILKSRDITLPTKVHLVKAVVFPLVMVDVRVGL